MTVHGSSTVDPEFTRGHANFPRFGWTIFGLAMGAVLSAVGGYVTVLGVLLAYLVFWLPWAAYLLGRRHAGGTS